MNRQYIYIYGGFPHSSVSKEFACNAGDQGLIPGLGRSPGEGNGNQLQYFCLENPMDRRAWWATVHGVTRDGHDLMTISPPHMYVYMCVYIYIYIYIYISVLIQILFPFRLLENAEQSSLCYTVGPHWLSINILNITVCTCQSQTLSISFPPTFSPW